MTTETTPGNVRLNDGLGPNALTYARERVSLLGAEDHTATLNLALDALDGLPVSALIGGWTFKGFTAWAQKLESERDGFKQSLYAELDTNLRLRELGGAKQDEAMTPFLERLIAERDAMRAALQQKRAEYEDLQQAQRDQSRNLALALRKLEQSHTGMWRGDEKAGEVSGYTNGWGDCLAALKKMVGLGA